MITSFPDFQTTIDHILADDDRVVVFTTTNGTHQGPLILAPVPPTGIENGKIIEHWDVIESLDMIREIGAITFNQQQ
jgi:predicted ester cyclase